MAFKRLGMKVRALREQRGWSQAALARKVKVSQVAICLLEQGKLNPTLAVLQRLAKALKVTVAELLT